ncbi:MAG: hypothetical protein IJ901_01120 [Bacteroidaceae bacterium]|nr:hypothetical protein [Bacteroidaceae bacterium]
MQKHTSKRETNEIIIFLINLFFLEVIGKFLVTFTLFLFRLFGMEKVADSYYALPRHSFYTFFIILCIVTLISIIRVVREQQKRQHFREEDEE